MKTASPFLELPSDAPRTTVIFDGQAFDLTVGIPLASALLAAGVRDFRNTPVSGAPRAPYCMMGACYDCLVEIDGVTRQSCMVSVSEGLVVSRAHQPKGEKDV